MRVIELDADRAQSDLRSKVGLASSKLGLSLGETTLARFPGCVHWHLTKPGTRGVLELTWWPKRPRLWFKVASNREADWIDAAIQDFILELECPRL